MAPCWLCCVFLLGWSQGLVWGCVVEVWSSCGEKRGPQRWGICLELHIKNNSVKLGGGSLFSLPSMLLWLEDWWTRSLSAALPPSCNSSPNPGETLLKNKKQALHPRSENRRISLLMSSLLLCPIPWLKGNWKEEEVCWTYSSESQYITGGIQGRDLRQVSLLFHIALPLTKELTQSQRNIAGAMEKGSYWLSPKRIKVGKEE